MRAGWRKYKADREAGWVTFRRAGTDPDVEALDSLKPRTKQVIYDILKSLQVSVDQWHVTKDGDPVEQYRSNPQFCYNWSFGSVREGFVLCLWYGTLLASDGVVYWDESVKETALELERLARATVDPSERSRVIEQSQRAWALDEAIRESYGRGLPVHVIVCDGDRRARDQLAEKASAVSRRFLDPEPWYVHRYDKDTGASRIVRGKKPEIGGDDADEPGTGDETDLDDRQQRAIKTRRGQRDFRERLLAAYRRRCAVTGSFTVDLLEAAHIVPHSVNTDYDTRNGILLRADIHTLFDLHLLTIDARLRVKLSKALRTSEYKDYDGKELKVTPERLEDCPSVGALEKRLAAFAEAEAKRT
ncbi:hypothetical protein G3O01_09430 [Burkholderia sp. Ac-20365]|nr:hypothetical protein [Burkholderia sp. Ac-20365]